MPPVDIQKCAILKVDPYSATVEIEEPVDVDRPRAEGVPIEPIHTRVGIIVGIFLTLPPPSLSLL